MTNELDRNVELYLEHRPQITVLLNTNGEVVVSTARIDDTFNKVELDDVRFPLDDARKVGEAILALVERAGA